MLGQLREKHNAFLAAFGCGDVRHMLSDGRWLKTGIAEWEKGLCYPSGDTMGTRPIYGCYRLEDDGGAAFHCCVSTSYEALEFLTTIDCIFHGTDHTVRWTGGRDLLSPKQDVSGKKLAE